MPPVSTAPNHRSDGASNIKAVILDYGQVLARCPTVPEFKLMSKMFNVDFDKFYKLWDSSRGPYDRGDLTAEQYWLQLAEQTKTTLTAEQIEELRVVEVEIWVHVDAGMLDWLDQLHAAGMKVALLSNMPWDLIHYVRKNFAWLDNFSFKTFSAEVRLIKPDPAIYEHTLRGLGVAASGALFVDDREANIDAARKLGIPSIQFQSIPQLRKDLAAMAFPILPAVTESSSGGSREAASPDDGEQKIKFQL